MSSRPVAGDQVPFPPPLRHPGHAATPTGGHRLATSRIGQKNDKVLADSLADSLLTSLF